jgi:hypothetical protein
MIPTLKTLNLVFSEYEVYRNGLLLKKQPYLILHKPTGLRYHDGVCTLKDAMNLIAEREQGSKSKNPELLWNWMPKELICFSDERIEQEFVRDGKTDYDSILNVIVKNVYGKQSKEIRKIIAQLKKDFAIAVKLSCYKYVDANFQNVKTNVDGTCVICGETHIQGKYPFM